MWLALRLKGLGEIDDVAAIHGLEPDDTEWLLAELDQAGHCMFREVGGVPKFILTPTGRDDGEAALAAELDAAGARDAVTAAYRDFLALNPKMLQLCTDWQVLPADHPAPLPTTVPATAVGSTTTATPTTTPPSSAGWKTCTANWAACWRRCAA